MWTQLKMCAGKNPQYRMRLLHGPEVRADVHYAMKYLNLKPPRQIAQAVHCSSEAARRISKEINLSENIQ